MKYLFILAIFIQGCSQDCRPCREHQKLYSSISSGDSGFHGFQYFRPSSDGLIPASHCAPCSTAVTVDELLVCSGHLKETK